MRSVMILWITALALLFGISAATLDDYSEDKLDASTEASITQGADYTQFSGHPNAPLLKLPFIVWNDIGSVTSWSSLQYLDHSRDRCIRQYTHGVSHGRAPPVRLTV